MGRNRDSKSPSLVEGALRRCVASRGPFLWLQIGLIFICVIFLLSRSSTVCVNFPIFMNLRSDACRIWEEAGSPQSGTLSWWQRACLLEHDWESDDYLCRDVRLMGNWPVCFDQPYGPFRPGRPCIVYSFGIAYDFRFDDALAYFNCTVYSFDPSMDVEDHKRGRNVHFKKIGLGAWDDDNFQPRLDGYTEAKDRWKIRKMSSIMDMLGHTEDTITLVKIDIEGNEWDVLHNMLEERILPNLPQLLIEWHIFADLPHSRFEQIYDDYTTFKQLGYRRFWMRNEGQNHRIFHLVTQAETTYVNTKFIPPSFKTKTKT